MVTLSEFRISHTGNIIGNNNNFKKTHKQTNK